MKTNARKLVQWLVALVLTFAVILPAVSVSAQDENVLRVQTEVEIASLDPNIATDGTSMEAIAAIEEGLMTRDTEVSFVEVAADSYETNEDETVYTFKLRVDWLV